MRFTAPSPAYRTLNFLIALLMAALIAGLFAGLARAKELTVDMDHAQLVHLDKPGVEVIIGNPSIADVTVQSGKLLVVTGKSVGLTNIMVLDNAGSLVYSKQVSVTANTKQLVTVNKGKNRETYSCSPLCGPALIPGDTPAYNDELGKAIRNKLGLAQSAAEGTTAQQ